MRSDWVSNLVNGNAALTAEIALRIKKAFGVSIDMLLRMQAAYDAAQARSSTDQIDVKPYAPA